ncbi:hypothetical protein RND71_041970 [Anisodus tanguticus]|uniref:Plastocyanin-like domain-containing protein n=1 Tax=Anisodus tanguticus TaxID=243964 RepID=A0AAE1UQA3_9SOLA|nr:hypothetical protein RND71_041970 [Anisodus tanguticus]
MTLENGRRWCRIALVLAVYMAVYEVVAEDPYRYFDWRISFGDIYPLGVRQQVKDQIGSFFYFPSLQFHKAADGFGGIRILSRPRIPVPFPEPAEDFTVLIGDWYKTDHNVLKTILDRGKMLKFPDGIQINGLGRDGARFTVEPGKTYRLRISNVGLQNSLNFRIQGHRMKLVEVEGTHTIQITLSSLDVHVGQSYSVLFTADQPAQDYYIAVSSRFTTQTLNSTTILHYSNSKKPASGPLPLGPPTGISWSLNQARSISSNQCSGSSNKFRICKPANSKSPVYFITIHIIFSITHKLR